MLFFQIEACGGQAITFGGDVSKEADVDSMMKAVSAVSLCNKNALLNILLYQFFTLMTRL